jgi:hypothetical protein
MASRDKTALLAALRCKVWGCKDAVPLKGWHHHAKLAKAILNAHD